MRMVSCCLTCGEIPAPCSGILKQVTASTRSNAKGETLLHRACSPDVEALTKGSDTLVRQLLQAGADPNSRFREGFTTLMRTRSPDVANSLLHNGADIARQADGGLSTLQLACANGCPAVVKVLLGALRQILKVGKLHTPLSAAANSGIEDVALLLLHHLVLQPGFDINHSRLAVNQPLLCCAAIGGLCRVAEFALDHVLILTSQALTAHH
jgi:ankyrin repeat protein